MKHLDRSFYFTEMNTLQEQFPRSAMSQRKLDLVYLSVRHLDEKQFASVVDGFIADAKFMPNVQDFKDRIRAFATQKGKPESCEKCTEGVISVYHKKTGINYAFACTCLAGHQYPAFQKWADQNANLFTTIAPHKIFMNSEGNPYEGKILTMPSKSDVQNINKNQS